MQHTMVRVAIGAIAALISTSVAIPVGSAAPVDPIVTGNSLLHAVTAPNGSYVEKATLEDDRHLTIYVHSASMNKTVPLQVQRPADTSVPRPVLYLLNGAGGGEDSATWEAKSDALEFLADKNVNVVSPVGGKWSYYADWRAPDPELGVNKWQTFLLDEIPPLVDAALGSSGLNALAGISTSGTTVLALAEARPGMYKSVAAYSGCAQISDPIGYQFVKVTVNVWGGGNVDNMYGPQGDPMWAEHDPVLHAEKLRGTTLYVSSGNGLPGSHDTLTDSHLQAQGPGGLANQMVVGGAIEVGTNFCSHNLANKLSELQIPATFNFRPNGTHSWGYWEDDFKASWPVIAPPIGL
ncbi:alpha/beta hydrolase family protein [Skermania piniformis]